MKKNNNDIFDFNTNYPYIYWNYETFFKKNNKKRNKIKYKEEEDKLLRDLKYLQKRLLIEPDMNVRIEIMKKIELISSIYN